MNPDYYIHDNDFVDSCFSLTFLDSDSIGSGFGGEDFVSGAREGSSGGSASGRVGGGGSTSGVAGSLADLDDTSQSGSVHNVSPAGGSAGGGGGAATEQQQPQTKSSAFPKISLPGKRLRARRVKLDSSATGFASIVSACNCAAMKAVSLCCSFDVVQ